MLRYLSIFITEACSTWRMPRPSSITMTWPDKETCERAEATQVKDESLIALRWGPSQDINGIVFEHRYEGQNER